MENVFYLLSLLRRQRLLREVIAHAELQSHPYIVRYFSAWEEDNHMIIQNEYCQGGTLARLFEKHYNRNIYFHERTLITILKHLVRTDFCTRLPSVLSDLVVLSR